MVADEPGASGHEHRLVHPLLPNAKRRVHPPAKAAFAG
jgi:hypothetical protein